MSFVPLFAWVSYSRKLLEKIKNPIAMGKITHYEDKERLVVGEEGKIEEGNFVRLYLLVDTTSGEITNAKFIAFGETALIGAAEILCELLIHKNYDQAGRITADLIDSNVRDHAKTPAFPEETFSHINLTLAALDEALENCQDIPLPKGYVATPVDLSDLGNGEYPDWNAFTKEEKLKLVGEVIANDIRPYVELDEGGVDVKELKDPHTIVIGYEGSCTSCYAATGSTLSAIQQILRAKVHPQIIVEPDLGTIMKA